MPNCDTKLLKCHCGGQAKIARWALGGIGYHCDNNLCFYSTTMWGNLEDAKKEWNDYQRECKKDAKR